MTNRVALVDAAKAPARSQALLTQIQKAMGATPAMFRAVANSPAALQFMWAGFGALGGGRLGTALGEQIAVAVAEANRCHYCLAAHTALGQGAGLSAAQLAEAQLGRSSEPRTQAALRFALALVRERGQVGEAELGALRDAGFDDEEIVELIAHVALNLFTNYVNNALAVPVDFPAVALRG